MLGCYPLSCFSCNLLLLHKFFHHWALTSLPFNLGPPLGFDTDGLGGGLLPFLVPQYCGARNLLTCASQINVLAVQVSAKWKMDRRMQEKQWVRGYETISKRIYEWPTVMIRVEEKQKQDGTHWNHSMGGCQKDCNPYYPWWYIRYKQLYCRPCNSFEDLMLLDQEGKRNQKWWINDDDVYIHMDSDISNQLTAAACIPLWTTRTVSNTSCGLQL